MTQGTSRSRGTQITCTTTWEEGGGFPLPPEESALGTRQKERDREREREREGERERERERERGERQDEEGSEGQKSRNPSNVIALPPS